MRLIDADEVANCYERMIKILDEKNALQEQVTEFEIAREYLQWAFYVINNTPTVDAVEVVRCKDCEFSPFWFGGNGNWKLCPLVDDFVKEQTRDDYCSYGERKEEND